MFRSVSQMLGSDQITTVCQINHHGSSMTLCTVHSHWCICEIHHSRELGLTYLLHNRISTTCVLYKSYFTYKLIQKISFTTFWNGGSISNTDFMEKQSLYRPGQAMRFTLQEFLDPRHMRVARLSATATLKAESPTRVTHRSRKDSPFKDEWQTALFKDPVRTAR